MLDRKTCLGKSAVNSWVSLTRSNPLLFTSLNQSLFGEQVFGFVFFWIENCCCEVSWISFRKQVVLRWDGHTSKCSFLLSLSLLSMEGKMVELSFGSQTECWELRVLLHWTPYPFPMDIARVAMQFGCRTRAGQHTSNWLSLFSHLHPLKCQEIVGTQKDALERREITPKREIKSSIFNSLDMWCLYTYL